VAAGVLEAVLPALTDPAARSFVRVWEATGRGTFDLLVAFGLWKRVAIVRTLAMIYCLGAILTYAAALGLAWIAAPFHFSRALVLSSLFEVPSCAVLYPWLRSSRAAAIFTRPLFPA
jgi:hypothetical protein